MADRIINANMLKSKPKINFSANNIIQGVEWEESTFNANIVDVFNGDFSLNKNYSQTYFSDFGMLIGGAGKRRFKVIIDYERTNQNVATNYNLIYSKNYDKNIISADGYVGTSFYEVIGQYGMIDYNNINIPTPSNVSSGNIDNEINQITNFIKKTIGISYFTLTNRTPYAFTLKIDTPIKVSSVLEYWTFINGKNVWEYYGDVQGSHNTTSMTNGKYYISTDISSVEKTNKKTSPFEKPSIVLNSNELMQADTTINGIPIGQHIANDILSQYKNGKATINCTVNISDGMPLFVVGEIAKVYGFDGKSVLRNRDGTDKRFKITSAEIDWVGETTQNIEIVEVIN